MVWEGKTQGVTGCPSSHDPGRSVRSGAAGRNRRTGGPRQGILPGVMGNKNHYLYRPPLINFLHFFTGNHEYFHWKLCSCNSSRNPCLIPKKLDFSRLQLRLDASGAKFFFIREHNKGSSKGPRCCVYEKKRVSGLYPFRGRLSGAADARIAGASRPTTSRLPPDSRLSSLIYSSRASVGRPE